MRPLSLLAAAASAALLLSAGSVHVDARVRHHVHKAAHAPAVAHASDVSAVADGQSLVLSVDQATCAFSVGTSAGDTWLRSGDIGVIANGQWYKQCAGKQPASCAGDDPLPLAVTSVSASTGVDSALGAYTESVCEFAGTGADADRVRMQASIRYYVSRNAVVFGQHFPVAMTRTNASALGGVASAFPSFAPNASLGFISYQGTFIGDHKQGVWSASDETSPANLASGVYAGPTVVFPAISSEDAAAGKPGPAAVISSFSSFMSVSAEATSKGAGSGRPELQLGVQSGTQSIPAGYENAHVLVLGRAPGIAQAIADWGRVMRDAYAKPDRVFDADPFIKALAYNTDRGSAYWWNTQDGKNFSNYESTLHNVKAEATELDIPYHSILLDSWWYPKRHTGSFMEEGGVLNWTALPDVLPHGLLALQQDLRWQIVAHNRWWSNETQYATRNGGPYNFVYDDDHAAALPQDDTFWDFLFGQAYEWGLRVYEQDWLDQQFLFISAAQTDVTVAQRWLDGLAAGAQKHGILVQMCMPMARHLLSSVQYPAVTQARATGDYEPGNDQWKLGYTAPMLAALGLAPIKDTFWTSQSQDTNSYYKGTPEPRPALQAAVATLSTGAVAPGDELGLVNRALLMKSARADGILLKPDVPLHALEAKIRTDAWGIDKFPQGLEGYVMLTTAALGPVRSDTGAPLNGEPVWPTILVGELKQPYKFQLNELGFASVPQVAGSMYVAWRWSNATSAADPVPTVFPDLVSSSAPLQLAAVSDGADFSVYYLAPVLGGTEAQDNGVALLGEWAKWAPVSRQRITRVDVTAATATSGAELHVHMVGAAGERVEMAVATAKGQLAAVECVIGVLQTAVAHAVVDATGSSVAFTCSS